MQLCKHPHTASNPLDAPPPYPARSRLLALGGLSPPWRELGFPPSTSQPTLEHVAGQKRRRSMMRSSQLLRLFCGAAAVEEAGIDYDS
jgi:hypothetical protein